MQKDGYFKTRLESELDDEPEELVCIRCNQEPCFCGPATQGVSMAAEPQQSPAELEFYKDSIRAVGGTERERAAQLALKGMNEAINALYLELDSTIVIDLLRRFHDHEAAQLALQAERIDSENAALRQRVAEFREMLGEVLQGCAFLRAFMPKGWKRPIITAGVNDGWFSGTQWVDLMSRAHQLMNRTLEGRQDREPR